MSNHAANDASSAIDPVVWHTGATLISETREFEHRRPGACGETLNFRIAW